MKLSIRKSAAVVAALSMATTGALMLNQNKADAATVATTHSGSISHLYTENGKMISNRALAPNTPWLVGKITTINGETMYQVSTHEYLSSKDSSLNGQNTSSNANTGTVLTITGASQRLYNDTTKSLSNRALATNTKWQVGKVVTNSKGERYYQVSTHEWVKKSYSSILNHDTGDGQYIADFMIKDGSSSNSSSNTNDDNNQTTTTPSTDNNNNGNTDVTTPDTNQNSGSQQSSNISASSVQAAVLASINAERQSKGLNPLTNDPAVQKMAEIRSNEIASTGQSTTRADGSSWSTLYKELGITFNGGGQNIANVFADGTDGTNAQEMAEYVMHRFRIETFAHNHYDIVMNPSSTKVGISAKYLPEYNAYKIVEIFA